MTKQTKTIIGIIIVIALLILIGIGVMKLMEKDFDNSELDIQKELKVTFQYNEALENEYKMNINGEQKLVTVSDIQPNVDTSKMGQSKHTVKIDGKDITLNVIIDDLRKIKLSSEDTIEVPLGISTKELEEIILKDLVLEGVQDKDDVSLEFIYSDKFTLDKKGELGQVTVLGKYKDNQANRNDIRITITTPGGKGDIVEIEERPERPERPEPVPVPGTPEREPIPVKPEPVPVKPQPVPVKPQPVPVRPEPTPVKPQPVPVRPEPTPVRPEPTPVKPEPVPVKPSGEARFPLLYPELLPAGAKLIKSSVNPGVEEFYKYEYTLKLSGVAYTSTASVAFNENIVYNVTLDGKDLNGEILSFRLAVETGAISYNWQIPRVTDADFNALKEIAQQFAAAYGF